MFTQRKVKRLYRLALQTASTAQPADGQQVGLMSAPQPLHKRSNYQHHRYGWFSHYAKRFQGL